MLDAAISLEDLTVPPANRLEKLKGDREGQWSIRVNDQWRVCFGWKGATPTMSRSSTTTEESMKSALAPVHPGEILLEEFMQPLGITQYRLAKETDVPARRINEIVQGRRSVTADTALRLAKYFGTSEMFWLNLQARYDLDMQREKMGARLAAVRPFARALKTPVQAPRSSRALVTTAKSGAVRSGYRRKTR